MHVILSTMSRNVYEIITKSIFEEELNRNNHYTYPLFFNPDNGMNIGKGIIYFSDLKMYIYLFSIQMVTKYNCYFYMYINSNLLSSFEKFTTTF